MSPSRPLIVRKFGGTSVGSPDAMRRVASIIKNEPCMVVLSAMSGVTQMLLDMVAAAHRGERAAVETALIQLRKKHHDCAAELLGAQKAQVTAAIDELLDSARMFSEGVLMLREASPRTHDAVASLGERLSATIFSAFANAIGIKNQLVDARQWLRTDDQFMSARPMFDELPALTEPLRAAWQAGEHVITMGFIGGTKDGLTTTLGRGGSDYSAAILGAAVDADRIEIWTDVTGVMTADPRVVKLAKPVPRLTYNEAAELAYFGAKVLHPATVRPAVDKNIPVVVLNTMAPDDGGTAIDGAGDASHPVKAITTKSNVIAVTIESGRMLGAHGFLRAIFEAFDRHGISIDVVATAEVSVTVTLSPHATLNACVDELKKLGQVTVDTHRSVVAVIGEGVKATPGVAGRIFGALAGVNVELVSMGASRLNLSMVVKDTDRPEALAKIHQVLFEGA